MDKKLTVGIFAADRGQSTNPSMIALLRRFDVLNWQVDLYGRENPKGQLPPFFYSEKIRHCRFPEISQWRLNSPRLQLNAMVRRLLHTRKFEAPQAKVYDILIGVDARGIVEAQKAAEKHQHRWQKRPVMVFLSFEQMFRDELSEPWEFRLKRDEIAACQSADIVVVQDPVRESMLREENGLSGNNFYHLPVASGGHSTVLSDHERRSLREKYKFPQDKIVALHAGSFCGWTCAKDLIETIPTLAPEIVVVIHTRWNLSYRHNEFLTILRDKQYPNVILSTSPLEHTEYEQMVSAADVGLVFYKGPGEISRNVAYIGLSSGKLSSYLKQGVPVVSHRQPGFAKLFAEYKAGIDIPDWSNLSDAILQLGQPNASYRTSAQTLFNDVLSFDSAWKPIELAMIELQNTRNSS